MAEKHGKVLKPSLKVKTYLPNTCVIYHSVKFRTWYSIYVFHSKKLNQSPAVAVLTLLGLGLIKINDVSANFNNPRPSLILNN